jgi:hypothetical protein
LLKVGISDVIKIKTSKSKRDMNDTALTKYGRMLKVHLKDQYPEMYRQMVWDGELETFLKNRDQTAVEMVDKMMDQGMNSSEAQEVAISDLLNVG